MSRRRLEVATDVTFTKRIKVAEAQADEKVAAFDGSEKTVWSSFADKSSARRSVGILGGTGLVGRMLAKALVSHPTLSCGPIIGSANSAGRAFAKVWAEKEKALEQHYGTSLWKGDFNYPQELNNVQVVTCADVIAAARQASSAKERKCDLIISAIAPALGHLEDELKAAGFTVVSISPYKRQENPLCVLEANADVLETALNASAERPLIKSPNCVCCGTSVVLSALAAGFGGRLEEVSVTTFQSLSGRGDARYPSEKVVNNVYPLHGTSESTEALIHEELETVLGARVGSISVSAYRVSVQRGHLVDVRVKLSPEARESLKSVEEVYEKLEQFDPLLGVRQHLPSVPSNPIVCVREGGCPRPATHHLATDGYAITVGNAKLFNGPYDICLTLVVDNLVKGALGAGLQLLEYTLYVEGEREAAAVKARQALMSTSPTEDEKHGLPARLSFKSIYLQANGLDLYRNCLDFPPPQSKMFSNMQELLPITELSLAPTSMRPSVTFYS